MNLLICVVFGALLGFSVLGHAQGIPEDRMDIAGIRVGMTEAEARAALAAFDATLEVVDVWAEFNYDDGVSYTLKSPEFLDRLEAHQGNQGAAIRVYFSGPVGDAKVIGVSRSGILPNPPTAAQFMDGLIAKYGQPSGFSRENRTHPVWEGAGKTSCVKGRDYRNVVVIDVAAGLGESLMNNSSAEDYLVKRGANHTAKGLIPADPSQCGTYLAYHFFGDPVSTFGAEVYDLGAAVATERSRAAWVEQLQAEAVRKRQGEGQVPRL